MNSLKYFLIMVCMLTGSGIGSGLFAQEGNSIPLWPDGAPGARKDGGPEKVRINEPTGDHVISNIHNPSITPFIPPRGKSTGVAVIIAPGGGHRELWIDHEGYNVARRLNEDGIAAFVLKYRLANEENSTYTVDDDAVYDMVRAVRLVRSRADEWHIDPDKVGVMGFSAGGEVAALTDMNVNDFIPDTPIGVNAFAGKPDYQALIYPGRSYRITPSENSSPVFIACGYKDRDDISKGMANLYLKFRELNVPAELHIYANAGHGFGIRKGDEGASSNWPDALVAWIQDVASTKTR